MLATIPVMPAPMSAGVFGMHRTMAESSPNQDSIVLSRTPATTDSSSFFLNGTR